MERLFAVAGSVFGLLAVACGAFGAHALRDRLEPRDLDIFEVAVRVQMYHALALLLISVIVSRSTSTLPLWSGWAFVIGVLIFSGSLYLLVSTGVRGLGAITPIGGLALLAGWALLIAHFARAH